MVFFMWIAFIVLWSIILLFLYVLRKHIFNRRSLFVCAGFLLPILIFQLFTMPFVTQKEALNIAEQSVSPYTKNSLYSGKAQLFDSEDGGKYWSVFFTINPGEYAEVYIDARSEEVIKAKINKKNGDDIIIE